MKKILFLASVLLLNLSSLSQADLMVKIDGTLDSIARDSFIVRVNKNDLIFVNRKALTVEDEKQFPSNNGGKVSAKINGRAVSMIKKAIH